jgi:FixJ family two-component response regulator
MLLTDFDMPGLTGYELAGQLRALRPDVRVLLTSGMPEDSITSAVKPPDWPDFIPKPFTICSLGHKLREVLEGPMTSHLQASDSHE